MPLKNTIRRAARRLVQLYIDAAKANAAQGHIPLATGPFGALDETRRTAGGHQVAPRDAPGPVMAEAARPSSTPRSSAPIAQGQSRWPRLR